MKLSKLIASVLGISRRRACQLIDQGLITVNGDLVESFTYEVDTKKDKIKYKDKPLSLNLSRKAFGYFAYYKPRGLSVNRDSLKSVIHKIAAGDLKAAGRLDRESEGLLLLSDDGEFIQRIIHPSYKLIKKYLVQVSGFRHHKQIDILRDLLKVKGFDQSNNTLNVELSEGQNRQIRRACAQAGLHVERLLRTAIGNISLDNLKSGQWRPLKEQHLRSIM